MPSDSPRRGSSVTPGPSPLQLRFLSRKYVAPRASRSVQSHSRASSLTTDMGAPPPSTREEARLRLRALGLRRRRRRRTARAFRRLRAARQERPRLRAHPLARAAALRSEARPVRVESSAGLDRWDGRGALGYLTLQAICDDLIASPPDGARVVDASNCFPTGALGYWVRLLAEAGAPRGSADRNLPAPARPSRRRPAADRHEPARDRDPRERRRSRRRRRLDGRGHPRRRARRARDAGGARAVRRVERAQGVRAGRRARAARRRTRRAEHTARCSSSRARDSTRCRRSATAPRACGFPGDA